MAVEIVPERVQRILLYVAAVTDRGTVLSEEHFQQFATNPDLKMSPGRMPIMASVFEVAQPQESGSPGMSVGQIVARS